MTIPKHPGKHRHPSIVTPRALYEYHRSLGRPEPVRPPPGIVLVFGPSLQHYVESELKAEGVPGVPHLYLLKGREVGIYFVPGIGGPQLATEVEEMAELGARRFIIMGLAGGLDPSLGAGSWVLCTRALRDEGTSHHYAAPARFALPSLALTKRLQWSLRSSKVPYVEGATWTTDAPYRETRPEVRRYRREGLLTVEMEAATLFVVGRYRKVDTAALFCVSDLLSEDWEPSFSRAREALHVGLEVAIRALERREKGLKPPEGHPRRPPR